MVSLSPRCGLLCCVRPAARPASGCLDAAGFVCARFCGAASRPASRLLGGGAASASASAGAASVGGRRAAGRQLVGATACRGRRPPRPARRRRPRSSGWAGRRRGGASRRRRRRGVPSAWRGEFEPGAATAASTSIAVVVRCRVPPHVESLSKSQPIEPDTPQARSSKIGRGQRLRRRHSIALARVPSRRRGPGSPAAARRSSTAPARSARSPSVQGDSGDSFDTAGQARAVRRHRLLDGHLPEDRGRQGAAAAAAASSTRSTATQVVAHAAARRPAPPATSACSSGPTFIVDNAAYCELDDSIVWDRAPDHLLPVLAARLRTGADRAGVRARVRPRHPAAAAASTSTRSPTIDIESQADCAAGAFAAAALHGQAPHFHLTAAELDQALDGYLQIRDSTPDSPAGHLARRRLRPAQRAAAGHPVTAPRYCFSAQLPDATAVTPNAATSTTTTTCTGGNAAAGRAARRRRASSPDLNRFWTSAGHDGRQDLHAGEARRGRPPAVRRAARRASSATARTTTPSTTARPSRNRAYYSITVPEVDPHDRGRHAAAQPARRLRARHAVRDRVGDGRPAPVLRRVDSTTQSALIAAICYAGAYAEDINRADYDATHKFILSPPDMDEATSAVLEPGRARSARSARAARPGCSASRPS